MARGGMRMRTSPRGRMMTPRRLTLVQICAPIRRVGSNLVRVWLSATSSMTAIRPVLADVGDVGEGAEFVEHAGELHRRLGDVGEEVVFFEEVEGGECGGAGEGVAGVGVAVEEGAALGGVAEEGVEDLLGGEGGGEG